MKALTYARYGPPEVIEISDVPRPKVGANQILVDVHASAVNTADWRIRAAAFPGIMAVPGRLMFGVLKPRNTRLGSEYAGVVAEVGDAVSGFKTGDQVFGMAPGSGASAEYVAVERDSAVAAMPSEMRFQDAAALPFGGLTALVFLRDYAKLSNGQRILIIGASGGVGCYAVQVAKALGAQVTGVSGSDNQGFVRDLGADETIDYSVTNISDLSERFDVVFDTVGALRPGQALALLAPNGSFWPLNFGVREIFSAFLNPLRSRKVRLAVNPDRGKDLIDLAHMVEQGTVAPQIDTLFPLERAQAAHALVEKRHRKGAVVLIVNQPEKTHS